MCRLKVAARVMNTHIFERVLPVEKTCLYPILIDPEALACYRACVGHRQHRRGAAGVAPGDQREPALAGHA